MQLKQQAQKIIERFDEVEAQLIRPEILSDGKKFKEFSRTRKSLEESASASHVYVGLCNDREEWERILRDPSDPEMQKAAGSEIEQIDKTLAEMEDRLRFLLVPRDARDASNAILEIRGGTGGDEASLFAGDLFKMYRYFCEGKGWKVHVLSFSEGTMGGYKEIIAEIEGSDVYGTLKYESGVHRVQRVPATEAQGRIHTSASTVAIMAEAEEVDDVEINTEDLRIDTYRSSGSGGQHVNKTDSAVRITHLPTGVVVSCQDEKSQIKNRDKAMKVLRSRLLDEKIAKAERERSAERKMQVGTGDRSGKIRTYNYPQGRVTDHRINLTLYNLDAILKGDLKTIFDALATEAVAEKLRDLERTA